MLTSQPVLDPPTERTERRDDEIDLEYRSSRWERTEVFCDRWS